MSVSAAIEQISAGLDALAGTDTIAMDDAALRQQVLALTAITNRLHAELVRSIDVFDRRGLAEADGFRTAKSWLQGVGRVPGAVAHRLVKAARLLRRLPKLATAAQSGDVPAEHVQQVARLADRVTVERVAEVEPILADAATGLDLPRFTTVCDRVRAHVDPDGSDPAKDFDQRGLSVTPVDGMVLVRGQLDPEGGAALLTALDAVMTPPGETDERSAGQRRADALVELARRQLTAGSLPFVGGQRPQVGVLLYPQALSPKTVRKLAELHEQDAAGQRLRQFLAEPAAGADWTRPGIAVDHDDVPTWAAGRTREAMLRDLLRPATASEPSATVTSGKGPPDSTRPHPPPPDRAPQTGTPAWNTPGWADPPWLNLVGPISPAVAQRIACDADVWRVILDPATGQPLDVGRTHRLLPHWIRRALYARDRGCRWPGCDVPAEWTDGHHLDPWAEGGETTVDRSVLLCRWHHGRVHEGGWAIDLDHHTGRIHITPPDGTPHLIPRTNASSWNGPTSQAA